MTDEKVKIYQNRLLKYWKTDGRKNLPWRLTKDPWKIILAEVLLRKTTSLQASTVYPLIATFSPADIRNLELDELASILKPLGLYKVRAAQLKKIAEQVEYHQGDSLNDPDFLESLPGIGKYIKNSVLCFAYDKPVPSLDTNMIRVIQRVFSYQGQRSRAREDKVLWEFAETLVPQKFCHEYNWAVLDLGAAICTAKQPKCAICPLSSICDFGKKVIPPHKSYF